MNTEPHHIAPKQQLESDCSARSQVPAFNDYTVFLLLEEERSKTKLACDAKCFVNTESIRDQKETTLNLPPRYQHLDLSAEWFISRLASPVQEPEDAAQIWKQLDTFSYLILRDLTKVLKKKHDQLRKPANIFQALVWEAQGAPAPNAARTLKRKRPISAKPKQDLGTWFDNWFQHPRTSSSLVIQEAPQHTEPTQKRQHLGTWFETMFRSSKIAPLQCDPLSESDESRFQEVDMTDHEIQEMWQNHNS